MNGHRTQRLCALLLCALLALTGAATRAQAEPVRGAVLLTWEQDGQAMSLYLNENDYDWRADPDGRLAQILPAQADYAGHGEQEEPCAVMRLRMGEEEACVEVFGEAQDYARAASLLAGAMGVELAEDAGLTEALGALNEREEATALCDGVTIAEWTRIASGLWNRPEEGEEASGEDALTFGRLYADLTDCLSGQEVCESLDGYRSEFEAHATQPVNWAVLLSAISEVLLPSGESYPYLVFGPAQDRRLILQGEEPEYTVKLFVDDECIGRLTVREGEDVEIPAIKGVTWLGDGKNIRSDIILCGYTTKRVTYRLVNAEEYADLLRDCPVEWVQNVLYGHFVCPSVHYMEALSEKGLRVEWAADAGERVQEDRVIEGRLVADGTSPAPSASPVPSASPSVTPMPTASPEASATPMPQYTVTFVFPPELGYSAEESRVSVQVAHGGSAQPPQPDKAHQKEHYALVWPSGWEQVTADATIEGVLEPKTYTIRFRVVNADGKEVYASEQPHVYGQPLELPTVSLPAGERVEWQDVPEQITGDCEIAGRIAIVQITVRYRLVALDGTVSELGEEVIPYGGNATLPVIEIPEGCEVTWSGALSGLTEDTVVTGKLTLRHYTVTVEVFAADGSLFYTSAQQVSHGGSATAPAFTVPDDCTFAWDEGTRFDNVTADRTLTGRLSRKPDAPQ